MKSEKQYLRCVLAAVAVAVAAWPAHAADKFPAPIQGAIDSGFKFETSFEATSKVKGWILSQGVNNNTVLYTTGDGEVAIAGTMIDAKGHNLTKQHLEKYAPKPDYQKLWTQLEASSWVAEGPKTQDAKSIIYVIEDGNCGFCHLTWKALLPYTKAGLQIRWVPVAILGGDSLPKATKLLAAQDGNAALAELHANFGKKGGTPEPVIEALKGKVHANGELMEHWGFGGTPTLIYRDKAGKIQASAGMPKLTQLPEITGLAAQANTDPALDRYR